MKTITDGIYTTSCVDHTFKTHAIDHKHAMIIGLIIFIIALISLLTIRSIIKRKFKFEINIPALVILSIIPAMGLSYKLYDDSEYRDGFYSMSYSINEDYINDWYVVESYYEFLCSIDGARVHNMYDTESKLIGFFVVLYHEDMDRDIITRRDILEDCRYLDSDLGDAIDKFYLNEFGYTD